MKKPTGVLAKARIVMLKKIDNRHFPKEI
jgi:hypothetical protein